ncbi:GntR family transcriptional regulator [Maribacter sp. 2210JD10-5]|uniref:GntR family transcriptional regulator n=1 Tax=Maribacter sp. 2210JD10-5 TaxID=3386272 RepID=UPI0039BD2B1F
MFQQLFSAIQNEISSNTAVKSDAIALAINSAIENKIVTRNHRLPSVNEAVEGLSVARTTVVKAYKQLIQKGLVESRPRHGYFVISENTKRRIKVMLLLHSLNPFQEQLYNAFEKKLGNTAEIDVFFHHCNIEVFKNLVLEKQHRYGLFVITPFQHKKMGVILKELPTDKILIIDQLAGLSTYSHICQNFDTAVVSALFQVSTVFKKYKRGVLLFPEDKKFPIEIKSAFREFAQEIQLPLTIEEGIKTVKTIQRGTVYFVLAESDLVKLVKGARKAALKIGSDVGLLSYNDMPTKEVIADGISVISTDFKAIGKKAAAFVKNRKVVSEIMETKVILRNSL